MVHLAAGCPQPSVQLLRNGGGRGQRESRGSHDPKWLKAGISEDGQWSESKVGTPQGAVASPLLANVYLHYVFDLWIEAWRKKVARGDVIVVRYADDLVVGFEHRADAERFLSEFRDRLVRFG